MSFCSTCRILRPPRSFHCNHCGTCIELHDHHCPWVGTCVGKRNIRYFVSFLFWTAVHGLITAIYGAIFLAVKRKTVEFDIFKLQKMETSYGVSFGCMIYGAIFAATLFSFSAYSNTLVLQNITSNENIRKKWNAKQKIKGEKSSLSASFCQRFSFYYCEANSESRIAVYYQTLKESEEELPLTLTDNGDRKFWDIDNFAVLKDYGVDLTGSKTTQMN